MPLTRDEDIKALLEGARTIAVVGASDRPDRPSYRVMRTLQDHGYRVIPVNPMITGEHVHGEYVWRELSQLGDPIDNVDIFRRSDQAGEAVDQAIAVGAKAVWMQLGVRDDAAAAEDVVGGVGLLEHRHAVVGEPAGRDDRRVGVPAAVGVGVELDVLAQLGAQRPDGRQVDAQLAPHLDLEGVDAVVVAHLRGVGDHLLRRAQPDHVRGADLVASTPRQIYLQRALGLPAPRYLHVPVALDAHGRKLSKQAGARALPDAPVAALCAAWRFLEQRAPDETPASAAEFWAFARKWWRPARLPPIAMLPAPDAYNGSTSA